MLESIVTRPLADANQKEGIEDEIWAAPEWLAKRQNKGNEAHPAGYPSVATSIKDGDWMENSFLPSDQAWPVSLAKRAYRGQPMWRSWHR